MKKKWFVTWNRPEYKEYATETTNGYLLAIIRKEKEKFLCVMARLRMSEKGLPNFIVLKEEYKFTQEEAVKQISQWQNSA